MKERQTLETPAPGRDPMRDVRLFLTHDFQTIRKHILPVLWGIRCSVLRGEKRSFADDLIWLDKAYENAYRTGYKVTGKENIPAGGGFAWVISHGFSRPTFPWVEDMRANPLGALAAIVKATREMRGENAEVKAIACYEIREKPTTVTGYLTQYLLRVVLKEQYDSFWNERMCSAYDFLPVNSRREVMSSRSLIRARQALVSGEIVLIAPEGSPQSKEAGRGVAWLAPSGRPFLPAAPVEYRDDNGAIHHRLLIGGKLEPSLDEWKGLTRKERKAKDYDFAQEVMDAIERLGSSLF